LRITPAKPEFRVAEEPVKLVGLRCRWVSSPPREKIEDTQAEVAFRSGPRSKLAGRSPPLTAMPP